MPVSGSGLIYENTARINHLINQDCRLICAHAIVTWREITEILHNFFYIIDGHYSHISILQLGPSRLNKTPESSLIMLALPEAAQSPPVVRPFVPPVCKHHYNIEYRALFDLLGASFSFSWSRARSGPWRRWGMIFQMLLLLFPIHYWNDCSVCCFDILMQRLCRRGFDVCFIHSANGCFDHSQKMVRKG